MKRVLMNSRQLSEIVTNNTLSVTGNTTTDVLNNTKQTANAARSLGIDGNVTGELNSANKTSNTLAGAVAQPGCSNDTIDKVVRAGGSVSSGQISERTTKKKLEERRLMNMRNAGMVFTKSQLDEILKK